MEAERRLLLAARLESIGSLVAGVAHEINNPMAYVQANLRQIDKISRELSRVRLDRTFPAGKRHLLPEQLEILDETREGIDRIAEIVQQLKEFSHNGDAAPSLESIDLAQIADQAIAMARVGTGEGSIYTEFEPCLAVAGRKDLVLQIALNLLVNAVQASSGSADITVRVVSEDRGAALEVLDRGPGIPDHLLERIFDPFFTTKDAGEGSGLGLSISYELAKKQRGRLEAANRPGGGAAFKLWLPRFGGAQPLESA